MGTYQATGAALANPDIALWANADATANAFWAEAYSSGSTFYYAATIDSAKDRFKGFYKSSTATGTIDFRLPSTTGWLTEAEKVAADKKAAELADGLNVAAWKIAVALENLIPCADPLFGVTCGMIDVLDSDGKASKV